MPYYPLVPGPAQQIDNSQPQIQANFTEIQTGFSVDHVPYGTGGVTEGKHNKVTMPRLAAAPAAFGANDVGLYNIVHSGLSQLYVRRGGAAAGVPMTEQNFVAGTNGYTYLPSGLVIKFGQGITDGAGNATINLNAVGPAYAAVPFIQITMVRNPPYPNHLSYSVHNALAASFQLSCTYANTNFNWFAIATI